MSSRNVAALLHPEREEAVVAASRFIRDMVDAGVDVVTFPGDVERLAEHVPGVHLDALEDQGVEAVVVFGGDGTVLRAAEWAHPRRVPLLGVNLGHVGFLAELEPSDIESLSRAVINRDYDVEERVVLSVDLARDDGSVHWHGFAVNEVSLEKRARERMINALVSVDDQPLSRWGCDGVLVSTPTGSTAYAFSAGGPVVWPDVQAILLVPLSAHALFNNPMVLSPQSEVRMELSEESAAVIWCDGRRTVDVHPCDTIHVRTDPTPLLIARLSRAPFTTRLVRKFKLPVEGWGARRQESSC